jgi:hypothetical protein
LLFLLGGIVAYVAATQFLKIPGPLEEEKIIVIAPKSGSRAIEECRWFGATSWRKPFGSGWYGIVGL